MRTRKKWLWLILGIAAVAVGALIWSLAARRPPIILTLPNGDQYRFVGITYGTNMVPPLLTARLLNLLPAKLANAINPKIGSPLPPFQTGSPGAGPMYRFWFRRITTTNGTTLPPSRYGMVLADKSENLGGSWDVPARHANSQWAVFGSYALPRRSPEIHCRFYSVPAAFIGSSLVAQVTLPNLFFGHYLQWTPESLPVVKHDGDLEVRLDSVSLSRKPATPFDVIVCRLSLRSPTDFIWTVDSSDLDDATSNKLHWTRSGRMISWRINSQMPPDRWKGLGMTLPGTLWPDEQAWRLKVLLKRTAGFDSNEVVTLSNLPIPTVGSNNTANVTNGGDVIKVRFYQSTSWRVGNSGRIAGLPPTIQVVWQSIPTNRVVDFVEAHTDTGASLDLRVLPSEADPSWTLGDLPTNAHAFSVTFAIQKPRTVEFLVKPPTTN